MLRHAVWVAFSGILLAVPPALATPDGSPPETALETEQPKVEASVLPANTSTTETTVTPAAANPGASEGGDAAAHARPEIKAEGEPQPVVMPAAAHMPLPQLNPFKPEVTLKAIVDLSTQRMTVISRGEVLYVWPISSGRRGYFTPTGTFYPQWRARMWYSKQYDGAPMPYSVFFHRGYAVHGTYATGLLGRPASHGCIRLSTKNAATFYKLIDQHGMESTQIIVKGTTNVGAPKVAQRSRSTSRQRVVREQPRRSATRGYANYNNYYGYRYGYRAPSWVTW
ncbi:MAG: L,D-transpeptidase [Pseudomonadota bacterium]